MPSISFPKEWRLLSAPSFGIATSDLKLHCWTRRRTLNSLAVFGGQTLFGLADDARWVNSRALRPHLCKLVEGVQCAPSPTAPPVTGACALNLRVVEETGTALPDERAIVPPNAALRVRWEASELLDFTGPIIGQGESNASAGGGWEWRALDAPTGAVIAAGVSRLALSGATFEAQISAAQLGNDGRCLLFHVAATGVSKPLNWPADYQIVTGESQFKPAKYLWLHPTLGLLPFDPRYRVGALPYDRSDPVQAALLEETERLEAAKELALRQEWADKLITFNADGTPVTAGGEFSCLKIQSAGAWCGDANVSLAACAGACLWTGDETGVLTARVVEPRLRRVGDLLEEQSGAFWITGDVSTRNGLRTALLKLDGAWGISLAAYGDPFETHDSSISGSSISDSGIEVTPEHSRALLSARCGFGVERSRSRETHVLTFAGKMRLSIKRGNARLVRVGEGGRSGAALERLDGTQIGAHVLDPDRAKTSAFAPFGAPRGAGHVLLDASPYPGPAVAKAFSSALCAKETFWAVVTNLGKESLGDAPKTPATQEPEEFGDDQQGLARFTLGGIEVVKWWRAAQWDMGRVVPWARGIYCFGFGADGKPRAHRWSGDGDGLIELGLSLPFLVTWGACGLVPDGQSETLRIVGKKFFGSRELPGWYAAEGTYGSRGAGGITAGGGANTTDFGWNGVLGAFTISRVDLEAAGFDAGAFPPFLQWSEAGAAWIACASAPTTAQGAPLVPYLVFDGSGDPLRFAPGAGVTLPQAVNKWCGLRFTAGTCQGVVSRRIVPDPNCGPMDIALVLDRSGSMATALGSVVSELLALRLDLERAAGGDFRIALVTFDFGIYVEQTFTADFDLFAAKMSAVRAGLGAKQNLNLKYPEASDEALRTAIAGLSATARAGGEQIGDFDIPWRPDARKIAVLVTDDLPAGLDDEYVAGVDDANADAVAHLAQSGGVRISALYTPTGTPSNEALISQIMENYALVSNGLFLRTQAAGRGAGAALSDVINSCGGIIEETFVEYCTDDLVIPVSCCGDANCVLGDGAGKRVGVFRVSAMGPISAIWFQNKSDPEAFAAMCRGEARLWGRIDGTAPVALSPGGALSISDRAALSEFNIPVPLGREFWLPRAARTFELAVILDDGLSLDAELAIAH